MRQGEIMAIITDQALDAILYQQLKEQVFALTPPPPRSQPQCSEQEVSQSRFTGIIFGCCHCQHRKASASNHPCRSRRLIPQIANAHRLARARFCHNDMPLTSMPRLPQKALKPALKGSLDKAIEARQFASYHQSPSFSR